MPRMPFCELLFLLLIATFALPTGTVCGFPLKLTLLGLSSLTMLPFLFDLKLQKDRILLGFASVVGLLVIWTLWARHNGFSNTAFNCLKQFASLISVIALGWIGWRTGALDRQRIVAVLRGTALASILFKFAIEIVILGRFAVLPGLNPTDSMITILSRIFGAQLATCEIPLGFFSLYRVMLANDVLVLAVLPFELLYSRSGMRRTMVITGAAIFVLLTYSRVVMLQFLLTLFFCSFVSLPRRRFLQGLTAATLLCLILAPFFWEMAKPLLYDRLLSVDAKKSDNARIIQSTALIKGIRERPFIGHGVGSYSPDCIRGNGTERYSYELQYLSFVYQFGTIGFILIIGGLLFLCFRLCLICAATGPTKVIIWFNLSVWALKPLFNPQFLSSNSAAVIIATFFLGLAEKAKSDTCHGPMTTRFSTFG